MQSVNANSNEPEGSFASPQMVGEGQLPDKLQGHWVLARAGKRVLRPGGLELTRQMLDALAIRPLDRVVEFAPGLGVTARIVLQRHPFAYWGVERERAAAEETDLGAYVSQTVRRYANEASDEEWITLMGALNRSPDPGATCLKRAFEHVLRG